MDATAIGASTALLPWLLSEHSLHGLTFLGLLLELFGFLYLSYDLLGKPEGVLRLFLIVFTHLAVSLLVLSAFAPLMLSLFGQALRATNTPPTVIDPGQQFAEVIVYTLMIAILQGILIALPPPRGPVKRFVWRDGSIGFLFGLIFFYANEFVVFHTPLTDVKDEMLDLFFFGFLGVVGAGLWRRYGQRLHNGTLASGKKEEGAPSPDNQHMPGQAEPLPSLFAVTDFIQGLLFWYIVGGLSIMLWTVLYILVYRSTEGLLFYLVDLLIGVVPASLVCGSSQYITWKVHRLGEKQLGSIGAAVTLLGFLFGLIEPLVLFLRTP